jgi:hypothetical protein
MPPKKVPIMPAEPQRSQSILCAGANDDKKGLDAKWEFLRSPSVIIIIIKMIPGDVVVVVVVVPTVEQSHQNSRKVYRLQFS